MPDTNLLQTESRSDFAQRLRAGARLQEIEGNPLTADEIAMFERFEREGWSPERRRAHIIAMAGPAATE